MSNNEKKSAIINESKIEKVDRKPESENHLVQAEVGWNVADYDVRNTIEDDYTIFHGERVPGINFGMNSKYIRAFVFEGMINGPKGDDLARKIQDICSIFYSWDHANLSIRKIDRPDGLANYRIELLHANVYKLKQVSQILKISGSVKRVFEDIPRRENIIVK